MKSQQPDRAESLQGKPAVKSQPHIRLERSDTQPQNKSRYEPMEAILEAYAQDPERWDGLE